MTYHPTDNIIVAEAIGLLPIDAPDTGEFYDPQRRVNLLVPSSARHKALVRLGMRPERLKPEQAFDIWQNHDDLTRAERALHVPHPSIEDRARIVSALAELRLHREKRVIK